MLKGYFEVDGHCLNLLGYDINNTITLVGFTDSLKERVFFDQGWMEVDGAVNPSWEYGRIPGEETIYLSVGLSNMQVQKFLSEAGPSDINKRVFASLGSIVRGMKNSCISAYREDYMDMFFGEFNPQKIISYGIPNKGKVSLNMGGIHHMSYEVGETKLFLEEDPNESLNLGFKPQISPIKLRLEEFAIAPTDVAPPSTGTFYSLEEIIANNPDKNFSWLRERDYRIVEKDFLPELKKLLLKHDGVIAFDTETTGLNMCFKSQHGEGDQLVGLVFSVKEGQAFYVPLRHRYIENVCEEWGIQATLDTYFREVLETKELAAHNSSFDWKTMWVHGINCNIKHDTLAIYQLSLRNAGLISGVSLKYIARKLLGRDSLELSHFVDGSWGEGDLDFRDLYPEGVRLYACADTDNTLGLLNYAIKNDLFSKFQISKVYQIECLFSLCIGYQEFYGLAVDIDRAEELGNELLKTMEVNRRKIFELAGHEFNISSSAQLQKVLFEELGYPIVGYTDSGKPSAAKENLKRMAQDHNPDGTEKWPLASFLLRYKEAEKLHQGFVSKLPENATEDGFMFSGVNQYLETGRLSVSKPNYQSFDSTVKKYIVPRPGFFMMDTDYSAVEYRVLANMSGEQRLIEAFKDPDTDYHRFQASRMFGVPEEKVTPQLRQQSKGINFGLPYGLGDTGLGAHIFGEASPENTRKAAFLRKKYFEGQDNVRRFFDTHRQGGVDNGYVSTFFGRRRYFDKRVVREDRIRRQAGNHAIQGTAADLYKIAMGRLFHRLAKKDLLGKVLMSAFVHDELVMEVHNSIDPVQMLEDLKWAMEINLPNWSPLMIGVGYGRNWYEAKSTELPVYLQRELVEQYGEIGLPWWDGDGDKLYEWEIEQIKEHNKRRVVDWIKDSENVGGPIKVAISGIARDVLKDNGAQELGNTPVESLRIFAQHFGLEEEFDSLGLKEAEDVEVTEETMVLPEVFEEEDQDPRVMLLFKAKQFGVAADFSLNLVIVNTDMAVKSPVAVQRLRSLVEEKNGPLQVQMIIEGKLKNTNYLINTKSLSQVRDLFTALNGGLR